MMRTFEKVFASQSFKLAPAFLQNPVYTPPAHQSRWVSLCVSLLQRDPPWPPPSLFLHGIYHIYNHAVVLMITDTPQQRMGLHPNKPIISWWYRTLKMHLQYLTYQTLKLSLAHLNHAQNTYISLQLGKIISHKVYSIIKCWLSNLVYWILYWKWKTERLSGYRMVVSISVVYPQGRVPAWELWLLPCPASQEGMYLLSLARGKSKIQNSKYSFYWTHITFAPSWSQEILSRIIISWGRSTFI